MKKFKFRLEGGGISPENVDAVNFCHLISYFFDALRSVSTSELKMEGFEIVSGSLIAVSTTKNDASVAVRKLQNSSNPRIETWKRYSRDKFPQCKTQVYLGREKYEIDTTETLVESDFVERTELKVHVQSLQSNDYAYVKTSKGESINVMCTEEQIKALGHFIRQDVQMRLRVRIVDGKIESGRMIDFDEPAEGDPLSFLDQAFKKSRWGAMSNEEIGSELKKLYE